MTDETAHWTGAGDHSLESAGIAAEHLELHDVLLDLTMPRLDGRETFRELRHLRADLPVVLCSGYDVLASADRSVGLDFSG